MCETFQRLRAQARLQLKQRSTGERCFKILPLEAGRGFARLPRTDPGDLFLDLEGDPLYPDCLEYLMGLYGHDDGRPWFRAFWAHDHEAEKRAFEELADVLDAHFARHPGAHVYHYNHYEVTALRRLAGRYGTREDPSTPGCAASASSISTGWCARPSGSLSPATP